MKSCQRRVFASIVHSVVLFYFLPASWADTPANLYYHLLKEIPIGGAGGWDYLSMDAPAHRLYVTHGTKIVVIDTASDAIVGEIGPTPGVHGFAIASDLGLGFSSNGAANTISAVDLKTLQVKFRAPTGAEPDGILYVPGTHEVYTFNGEGKSVTAIDGATGKVVATISLPGTPESAAYDPKTGLIYDDIVDKGEVVAIDTKTHHIVKAWILKSQSNTAEGRPVGLAIDSEHRRLFVGTRDDQNMGPAELVMLDPNTTKILGELGIPDGVDADAFDPGTQLAFASTRAGILTVAHEVGPTHFVKVQDVVTAYGARTMALDPLTHNVYLATADFEPLPPGAPASARRKMVPGTMKVLVYGM